MRKYRSPFLLPEQPKKQKCTKPDDARRYPGLHSEAGEPGAHPMWGKECPVHSRKTFTVQNTRNQSDPWLAWYKYREEYAKLNSSSDDYAYRQSLAMARMLVTVTAENPPDVPPQKTWHQYETQLFGMHVQYWVLAIAVAVWAGFFLAGIFLP